MKYEINDVVRFTNDSKDTVSINGHKIKRGESIAVTLDADWDDQDGIGEGGPWGYGGYTSTKIRSLGTIDYTPDD